MSGLDNSPNQGGLISLFAQHRVAANLMMVLMLMAGVWGYVQLNVQFFPTIKQNFINITTVWNGASAEDIEEAISEVIEETLSSIDGVEYFESTSRVGASYVWVNFPPDWDMSRALNDINEQISSIRNLPDSAETPRVSILGFDEPITRFILAGDVSLEELRPIATRFERELKEAGISEVRLTGLPEQRINIEVSRAKLHELGTSLEDIGGLVRRRAQDFPAGSVGGSQAKRQLRSTEKRNSEIGFAELPVISNPDGSMLRLGDIAEIKQVYPDDAVLSWFKGMPAIEFQLTRAETEDTLVAAETFYTWLAKTEAELAPNLTIAVYDEAWTNIRDRLSLLMRNGLTGLIFIIIILFVFLNGRVAFWVMMGIPTSFLATLAVMHFMGLSINVLTTFALIMALGIIVDDAIVVGEDAVTHREMGESPLMAAQGGAKRMFWPVVSSSLTTIGAFMPLLLVGGIMGQIMGNIPQVIICVIIASIVECFFILPGHLHHSFLAAGSNKRDRFRSAFDNAFNGFKDGPFRRAVTFSIRHRWMTLASMIGVLIIAFSMLAGGILKFSFFPSPEPSQLYANIGFVSGTPNETVTRFIQHVEEKLWEVDAELGPDAVVLSVSRSGTALIPGTPFTRQGEQFGLITVELQPSDSRDARNEAILQLWESKIVWPSGLETLSLAQPASGPPGRDLQLDISGNEGQILKQAALELAEEFKLIPGVSGIEDNMPLGREQYIYKLTPTAHALGMTTSDIGSQLRNAFDGMVVQIFQQYGDEVEVRVVLPAEERDQVGSLEMMPIKTPNGGTALLGNLADFTTARGFDQIRHKDGKLSIEVSADVDETVGNATDIVAYLQDEVLPRLSDKYLVDFTFSGLAETQNETLTELKLGMLYGFTLIYVTLCWVFGSYGWPFMVMAIIPFGLTGALFGHVIVGIDMTLMSLFGFFGLSGIVVNDSIILVVLYRELRESGMAMREALVESSVRRLRAVILTSLTTIAGLLPILLETSVNAAFLHPMATTISFGLAFATLLVLFLVPVLLSFYEDVLGRDFDAEREAKAATPHPIA